MENNYKLLIVEDDDDMFEGYQETAEELSNKDSQIEIEIERADTAKKAIEALSSSNFDGAIVDLNLLNDPDQPTGNLVLHEIVDNQRFPVFVVSGNLNNLDPEIVGQKSNVLRFYSRDEPNEKIFNTLLSLIQTGVTKFLGVRGEIDQYLHKIFWKHLAHDLDTENPLSDRALVRYTINHLGEYLHLPEDNDRHFHEAEVYVRPPIRQHIATGDIVKAECGATYIVLSPACDIAVRNVVEGKPEINAGRIIIAPLIQVERQKFLDHGILKPDQDTSDKREKLLNTLVKGQREKFVFLPGHSDLSPSLIDFQNILTWSYDEFSKTSRVATVSGLFLKDIQSRFSAYVGRQGQPDLHKSKIVKNTKKLLSPES
ncbi:hypothetical protein ACJJIF_14970 [Microbulbifer sp. SSSA002]|uniref:hypothetical protein n=1 Tax=Microbulbifer sp. SSSA002 TaxID=3243376 RepID=UPI00403A0579